MSDELPERLRAAAEEFEPDGERMWDRVVSGMTEPPSVRAEPVRRRSRLPHLAVATAAVVVLIGAIVFAGYVLGPVGDGTAPAGPATSSQAETSEAAEPPEGAVEPSERPEAVDEADHLTAWAKINDNDNDYWSQSEIRLQTAEPITELTVELHVVIGSDVEATGSWTTSDVYFERAEVYEQDGYLVFRWTLVEGQTVEPGEYILSGQYNHGDGPRETDGDYFTIESTAASGPGRVVGDVEPAE